MNLAEANAEFDNVVTQHRDRLPLDADGRAKATADLRRAYERGMKKIDRYTAELRGNRSRFLSVNQRKGLVDKLDELHSEASVRLGLS